MRVVRRWGTGGSGKWYSHFRKQFHSLNTPLSHNPALLLLALHPITYAHRKTCMQRSSHNHQDLETIRMSFNDHMMNKQCYIHTKEPHSAIKRQESMTHPINQMILPCILPNERSQIPHPPKRRLYIFYNPIYMTFWKRQNCQHSGPHRTFWDDGTVQYGIVVVGTRLCIC